MRFKRMLSNAFTLCLIFFILWPLWGLVLFLYLAGFRKAADWLASKVDNKF